MPIIVAYKILVGDSMQALEAAVKEAIKQGWQPIGGVAVNGSMFYQAIAGH